MSKAVLLHLCLVTCPLLFYGLHQSESGSTFTEALRRKASSRGYVDANFWRRIMLQAVFDATTIEVTTTKWRFVNVIVDSALFLLVVQPLLCPTRGGGGVIADKMLWRTMNIGFTLGSPDTLQFLLQLIESSREGNHHFYFILSQ